MIPPYARADANKSERAIFMALEGIVDRPDWIVIHSLDLAQNLGGLMGETDFVVFAPGKGILLIEAKAPNYVEYKAGDWYLDKVPSPNKNPFKQLDGARRSIRGFLNRHDALGDEPIARMLWLTSLGRHQFDNRTPGDMQFFEWELGWHDDLRDPTRLVEKALDEHAAWFSEVSEVHLDRESLTPARAKQMSGLLLQDFKAYRTKEDQKRERHADEQRLLVEQGAVLDMIGDNEHVYFDGPAGTGKSYLLMKAARRLAQEGRKTLVTCWNLLMAGELQLMRGHRPDIDVQDFTSLMLSVCGLPANPADADREWYETTLPTMTLERLREKPYLGGYEAICVDEFQDVAANPLLLKVLFALAGTGSPDGTRLVFAGDDSQQILRPVADRVSAFAAARRLVPDLVHVRLRKNCRMAPALLTQVKSALGMDLALTGHSMAPSIDGGLDIVDAREQAETSALATALRGLLERYDVADIRVLSPFGETNSLIGRLLARPERSQDERWLRKKLKHDGNPNGIAWRSVFKFKGLEADAVVITDVGQDAIDFIARLNLDLRDLLYVGMTRAKYHCVVIDSVGFLSEAPSQRSEERTATIRL
nr:NERD domain-containing protein [Salinibacterium sp. ZJ454]